MAKGKSRDKKGKEVFENGNDDKGGSEYGKQKMI